MIYKLIIGLVLIATVIYYFFCFLEIFGLVKFTEKNVTVKIPQMFIPFYYLFVSGKKIEEQKPEDKDISIFFGENDTINVGHNITQVSIVITDEFYHGWSIDLPEWASLENNIGQGTKNVTLTIKRNARKSPRNGVITITDLKSGSVYEIEINQEAKPEN